MRLEARLMAQDAKVKAITKTGDIVTANDVFFEANSIIERWWENSPVGDGFGWYEYGFAVEVEDIDQDTIESQAYGLQEIIEIIDADYEILDEWRAECV